MQKRNYPYAYSVVKSLPGNEYGKMINARIAAALVQIKR